MSSVLQLILSRPYKIDMLTYIDEHPAEFKDLIEIALADEEISWRAAWLIADCMEENDERLTDHVQSMVHLLPDRSDHHQRELLRILQKMTVPEELEGYLFDHSIRIWKGIRKQPSVRLNAFRMIMNIAARHPELSVEIAYLAESHYLDSLSPGTLRGVMEMLKEFGKRG